MNATDLVIVPPERLFARTSPRARRTERTIAFSRPGLLPTSLALPARQLAGDAVACACGLVPEVVGGHVYNEEAFQYFLSIERKRIELGGNHLLLALVDLKSVGATRELGDADLAPKLFKAVRASLRETDFVGWYREKDVVGAVLPQFGRSTVGASTRRVGQRLCQGLAERLPATLASQLKVHVYEVPSADPG